jgi:methylated-DNA-[protein]-cysteine S-methyltransferase
MADAGFDGIVALPCAMVGVTVVDDAVAQITFLPRETPPLAPGGGLAQRACEAILAYAEDPSRAIELPLRVEGTAFQRDVWAAIARIPSGSTRTYGEIAHELGATARAVGQACGDNRLPLAIPCHRVVGAHGLGGFAHRAQGAMPEVKRWLIAHESRAVFALTP